MTLRRPPAVGLVVDTSAILAVLLDEPTADRLYTALRSAGGAVVSAGTLVEVAIVAESRFRVDSADSVRAVLDAADVVTMPVDQAIAEGAFEAWRRFGKGRHVAGLNFGDCFSYATAAHFEAPLLCVGQDFAKTDLVLIDVTTDLPNSRA